MTHSEENYLKTIYHLSKNTSSKGVSTNAIAQELQAKPSSVTDMLKKLADKGWVKYTKYQGVSLAPQGQQQALSVVRKHRLWELFLVEKLGFSWSEVHEVAEQLEHIQSQKLIDQIDALLGFPTADPHGHPIPSARGELPQEKNVLLCEISKGAVVQCVGVKNASREFLQYLDSVQIGIGQSMEVVQILPFDHSFELKIGERIVRISPLATQNIYVR